MNRSTVVAGGVFPGPLIQGTKVGVTRTGSQDSLSTEFLGWDVHHQRY